MNQVKKVTSIDIKASIEQLTNLVELLAPDLLEFYDNDSPKSEECFESLLNVLRRSFQSQIFRKNFFSYLNKDEVYLNNEEEIK